MPNYLVTQLFHIPHPQLIHILNPSFTTHPHPKSLIHNSSTSQIPHPQLIHTPNYLVTQLFHIKVGHSVSEYLNIPNMHIFSSNSNITLFAWQDAKLPFHSTHPYPSSTSHPHPKSHIHIHIHIPNYLVTSLIQASKIQEKKFCQIFAKQTPHLNGFPI